MPEDTVKQPVKGIFETTSNIPLGKLRAGSLSFAVISDSTATLQLAPDISMSRQHARLSVQLVAGKLMAQIVSMKANNPVIVNGKVFAAGQSCTLKSGDSLQLGMTKILFTS